MSERPLPNGLLPADIAAVLMAMAEARGPGRTFLPTDVAIDLAGPDEKVWRRLMAPIRTEVARLASDGRLVIIRKGRPVDPADIRGVYRLALAGEAVPTPDEGRR